MATTTITGNITAAPELRSTASGQPVCNFTLVENRRKRDAAGKWIDDDPLFMRVTAWGDLASNVVASVGKGQRLTVNGRLQPANWTKDDVTHREVELVADDVALSLRFAPVAPTAAAF